MVEDLLVKVEKFIFPVDFIELDMEEDRDIPIILSHPFLATGRALIDVQKCELTIRVQDEQVTFNVFKEIKFSNDDNVGDCFRIDGTNELTADMLYDICLSNALDYVLVNSMNTYTDELHDNDLGAHTHNDNLT